MNAKYDVIIVGSGPAGMAAAIALRDAQLSVLLVDEQPAPGGQIWRAIERNGAASLGAILGEQYSAGRPIAARLRASGATLRYGTQVWQIEDGFKVFLSADGVAECVEGKTILLATGAQERPNPFPGWTLPGVMTVGAAQIMLKNAGTIPEEPVWIAGAGPLPLLYMKQLLALGGKVAGFIDTAPRSNALTAAPHFPAALLSWRDLVKGARWLWQSRRAGVPVIRDVKSFEAIGTDRLERLRYTSADGTTTEVNTGLLLTHEGVVPSIHFSMALGCEHHWQAAQQCFAPVLDAWGQTTRDGIYIAGDGGGIEGADAASLRGEMAGVGIAARLGRIADVDARRRQAAITGQLRPVTAIRPFLDALYKPRPGLTAPTGDTIVCRCESVTAAEITAAANAGAPDPNQVKAATRAGMGPCQGRQCGYSVAALVAWAHDMPSGSVGFFNIRPPLKPVTLGEVAGLVTEELPI